MFFPTLFGFQFVRQLAPPHSRSRWLTPTAAPRVDSTRASVAAAPGTVRRRPG